MKELLFEKWDEIIEFLKVNYGIKLVSFNTWIKPLSFRDYRDDKVIIVNTDENSISNSFIMTRYSGYIKNAIAEVLDMDYEPDIEIISDAVVSQPVAAVPKNALSDNSDIILNPDYTFDNFVVSDSNAMVHAAALKVAEVPGDIYNPLYIYGEPGLGKTHLMHAIAHFILENSPNLKVMCVTSNKFMNDLIDKIRHGNGDTAEFRTKYRNIDVLLIDDIQFIIGKASTQEEFFHTFNFLRESRKQIVISSDKPPRDFSDLDERFRSRFESGLIVDITAPDFETKMAILKKKIEMKQNELGMKIDIDDECLSYIANNINTNIRSLEGALNKVIAMARINHTPIDLTLVEFALRDMITPNQKKVITPEFIIDIVCEHFDVNVSDIMSPKRDNYIAVPRQIAMFLSKRYTNQSSTDLAKIFGRDHSTIIHGVDKIEKQIKNDPSFEAQIDTLIKKLNVD